MSVVIKPIKFVLDLCIRYHDIVCVCVCVCALYSFVSRYNIIIIIAFGFCQ